MTPPSPAAIRAALRREMEIAKEAFDNAEAIRLEERVQDALDWEKWVTHEAAELGEHYETVR